MEKRLEYLSIGFQDWLTKLLVSNYVDLFLLYNLSKENLLTSPFSIKIRENPIGRRIPIKKSQGYLLFENKNEDLIVEDFLIFGLKNIKDNKCTAKGLANYLILIDRLGSLTDSKQYEITQEICLAIPLTLYEEMLDELVNVFNIEYRFDNLEKAPDSFKEWEDLLLSTQYFEPINNPIDLLRRVCNFRISEIPLITLIHKLLPVPRTSLLAYGINLTNINENDLLNFLKEDDSECTFFGALIVYEYNQKPIFLGESLTSFLILEKWNTVGVFFFRKIYNGSRKELNEETKKVLSKELDSWLINEFSTRKKKSILSEFIWPEDFLAFGGWLVHIEESEIDISFNELFINELSESVCEFLRNIQNNIPNLIADKIRLYDLWFNDPFNISVQHINSYLIWSILLSQKKQWNKIQKAFSDLCYELKKLYYGSYTANHLALNLSNILLCLLLTYPNINEGEVINQGKLDELTQLFINIIGFQWIQFVERNDLIWDYEKHVTNYSEANLLYIIKRLKEIPEPYHDMVERLKLKIREESTTKWPI